MSQQFKYRAFISYSHSDERWARWLHRALETYRVPRHLVGRETEFGPVPERLAPVFRDREELATATNLGETLTRALRESAAQVVICSPAAARSRWVNEEILTFKRLGRADRIFCLVVSGEPSASTRPETAADECFPNALTCHVDADGALTDLRCEPIAADARPAKDGRNDARLKLIAGLLGLSLDELKQREAQRRHRRAMLLVAASLGGMAITSTLATAAWFARNEAERQRARAEAETETARQTTRFMVDLFKVSDPSEALGNRITAREILDRGAERIERELADQPAIQATLMDTMGTVYTSLGMYGPAARLVREAHAKRTTFLGPDHPEVAISLGHLGEVLMLKGEYTESESSLRSALETQRMTHGERSPEVAQTLMLLADLASRQGRFEDAEAAIREALSIRQARYGSQHPDVAASIEALGLSQYDRGEYDEAVPNLRRALEMRRGLHPQGHPLLAQAMGNLAWALMDQGQLEEAERLHRESLAMKRRLYGAAHPEIATSLNNLAYTRELGGDDEEAGQFYLEALDMNRRLLGSEHPVIALNMSNLAFVLYREGRREAAVDLLRDALEMRRRTLGAGHPDVAASATSLAYWLTEAARYDEAARLIEESLAIREQALGRDHPQFAGTLTVKANLLLAIRRYDEARTLAAEASRILRLNLPADSWQVAAALNTEGAALTRLGDFAAAEPLLLGSLPGLEGSPIPGLPARGRQRLHDLYMASGRPGEAARYSDPARTPGSAR
jgi:tetratricopeptide (TPR) repeat protein